MTETEKLDRLIKVADMYYGEKSLTEKEIATELKCSPNNVSKMLKEARKKNILDIRINRVHTDEIRRSLIDRFRVLDVRIAPYVPSEEGTRTLIAREAANYFNEVLKGLKSIGISGGRTLHQMIDHVGSTRRHITIYPLTGLWRDLRINYVDSGALVHYLWMKCEDAAEAFWFPMEPIAPNTDARVVRNKRLNYMMNPEIKAAFDAANEVDLAFIGVAPLRRESSTIRQLENIGITFERLKRKKAVGVAGGVWFNANAKPVLEDYFLSVPLETFQKMVKEGKKAVVVAGGEEKLEAIRVFLEHAVCNVLITDGRTARSLLE